MNEEAIHTWFDVRCSDGPGWTSPDFDCYHETPIELRVFVAMRKLEAEISNGGLPQLLWNTFYHWRELLNDCETAYGLMGADVQRDAIQAFRALFLVHEAECSKYVSRCIQERDFSYFDKWCKYGAPRMGSEREKLFWTAAYTELETKRKIWIDQNREQLIELMEEP